MNRSHADVRDEPLFDNAMRLLRFRRAGCAPSWSPEKFQAFEEIHHLYCDACHAVALHDERVDNLNSAVASMFSCRYPLLWQEVSRFGAIKLARSCNEYLVDKAFVAEVLEGPEFADICNRLTWEDVILLRDIQDSATSRKEYLAEQVAQQEFAATMYFRELLWMIDEGEYRVTEPSWSGRALLRRPALADGRFGSLTLYAEPIEYYERELALIHARYDESIALSRLSSLDAKKAERKKKGKHPGYVYFVQSEETGRIKIGHSADPDRRLSSLQGSSPEKLILIGRLPGNREVERQIHAHFHKRRLHGEWFRGSSAFLREIRSIIKNGRL